MSVSKTEWENSLVWHDSVKQAVVRAMLHDVRFLERELEKKVPKNRTSLIRKKFPILVIDDEKFPRLQELQARNYDIRHMPDLYEVSTAENFSIILCDLLGVGKTFDETWQGAAVLKELRGRYPDKILIAFTGGGPTEISENASKFVDFYLKKDISSNEWTEALDNAIEILANPANAWRRSRQRLLGKDVTPIQLAILEDTFVRNVFQGKQKLDEAFDASIKRNGLDQDARAILNSLAASAIFDFLSPC